MLSCFLIKVDYDNIYMVSSLILWMLIDYFVYRHESVIEELSDIENDTIKSKRGDHHGIGLLNVKAVVDKYGGDMVLSCDENEFKAVVIL